MVLLTGFPSPFGFALFPPVGEYIAEHIQRAVVGRWRVSLSL